MADTTIKVLVPATSFGLMSLDEVKAAFGIAPADTTRDAQLQMLIDQYSDIIATICDRTFAKETVEETWRGDPPPYENYRIFLSHWPVADDGIATVAGLDGTVIDPANYELEGRSGKLSLYGGFIEPLVVTYTGGYELPDETPPALKAALQLMIQMAAAQLSRGLTTGVRSISHKESRVMYFDPNAANKSGKGPVIGSTTIDSLLSAYMRYQV